MKLSTLFIINAIVAGLFGLGMLILPGTLLSFYDAAVDAPGEYLARLLGAAFISIAIVSWMAKDASRSRALSAILLGFFLGESIGFVVSLYYQLQGTVNAVGWSIAALYLLFAVGFGYFYWKGGGEKDV